MSKSRRVLKWVGISIAALMAAGILIDLGHGIYDLPVLIKTPRFESEFRQIHVGMSKAEVREVLRQEVGTPRLLAVSTRQLVFFRPVVLLPSTDLVVGKDKAYPPSCLSDAEPRAVIVRRLWQKWDELRAERQQRP